MVKIKKFSLFKGHYRFEGPAFPSIRELILYQFTSGLPVTGRSGAILLKPIPRERWELNNDDVVLLDKIGRVSEKLNLYIALFIAISKYLGNCIANLKEVY